MEQKKIKAGFSLEAQTVERLEILAQVTRLSKSAIIDMLVEDYAAKRENGGHRLVDTREPDEVQL